MKTLFLTHWVHQTLILKGSLKNLGLFKTYFHRVADLGENNLVFLWFREQIYPFMFVYFFFLLPSTVVLRLFGFVFNKLTWQKLRCIWCLHKIMNCVCSFLCKVLKDSMLTPEEAVLWFTEAGGVTTHPDGGGWTRVCPIPTRAPLGDFCGWNTPWAALRADGGGCLQGSWFLNFHRWLCGGGG